MSTDHDAPSSRSKLRRHPERGRYDRTTIEAILDEALICHLGVVDERGPVVIPTAFGRIGDRMYVHGAAGNAALRAASSGQPVCVTVTLLDGLVLARSAFHHSMNYRSVVVFGEAVEVTDPEEKRAALEAIVEHLVPGRTADARGPNPGELRATRVVWFPLDEASAKVREAGPIDDEEDLALPIWAGVLSLGLEIGASVADEGVVAELPEYLARYRRGAR